MRVDETREHRPSPSGINHARSLAARHPRLGVGAGEGNPAVLDGEGGRFAGGQRPRVDAPVDKDDVGGRRPPRGRRRGQTRKEVRSWILPGTGSANPFARLARRANFRTRRGLPSVAGAGRVHEQPEALSAHAPPSRVAQHAAGRRVDDDAVRGRPQAAAARRRACGPAGRWARASRCLPDAAPPPPRRQSGAPGTRRAGR